MTHTLIHGNALHVSELLEPASVDLIVTSPPYFALRSYRDGCEACGGVGTGHVPRHSHAKVCSGCGETTNRKQCHNACGVPMKSLPAPPIPDSENVCVACNGTGSSHFDGQLGSEASPTEFVDALIACTRDWMKVMRPGGSIFVNLGDKMAGSGGGNQSGVLTHRNEALAQVHDNLAAFGAPRRYNQNADGIPRKSLMGLPWRYALRCIDELGLTLRAEIIWSKPNGLPESVTDRVRRSHEQWFWFQTSGGVEPVPEGLPLCPLCRRPVDAKASLVQRLKETNGGVIPGDLADHVRPNQPVQDERSGSGDLNHGAVAGRSGVAPLVEGNADSRDDGSHLREDQIVTVVDHDPQVRIPVGGTGQGHRPLAVDDSGEPCEVCDCSGHPLIVDDEAWLPQSVMADIMQMVADGEVDAQQAADFLSGDYVRTHSVWFHFTLGPTYFAAIDEVREAQDFPNHAQLGKSNHLSTKRRATDDETFTYAATSSVRTLNPLGKVPGSVWTIPSEPLVVPDDLGVDHFAAFPSEVVRRIILGWSPSGYCTACGEARRAVVEKELTPTQGPAVLNRYTEGESAHLHNWKANKAVTGRDEVTITGYACGCPDTDAPTRPAVVLDPFCGTGTTPAVASLLGRHGIGIDLSRDYLRLAEWRCTNDRRLRDKVLDRTGIPNPKPPVIDGQTSIFDALEETA